VRSRRRRDKLRELTADRLGEIYERAEWAGRSQRLASPPRDATLPIVHLAEAAQQGGLTNARFAADPHDAS
jgi:hypothetical protein